MVRLLSVRRDDGTELLRRPVRVRVPPLGAGTIHAVLRLPVATLPGRQMLTVDLGLAARLPVSPTRGVLSIEYTGQQVDRAQTGTGAGRIVLVAALLVVALALAAILAVRILGTGLRPAWARAVHRSAREGHPLVEMVVTTQNRNIGHRNVRYLRPGSQASVGGGRSAFLIYFVPVPPRMAWLRYDGRTYTFVPVKTDLFPDLRGPVPDCLGKDLPARSPRGYRFTIVFHKYISPLEEINRLMRSVRARPASGGRGG